MRFGDKWCGWMETCVFDNSMSMIFNEIPTKDLKVTRGLIQGYPLSPFLFLLVAKGFVDLLHQTIALGEFKPFHLNGSTHFELLQFAFNTILIGEGSWKNLLSIKTLLRDFELVSELQVNLAKSKLFSLNVDFNFCKQPLPFCLLNLA